MDTGLLLKTKRPIIDLTTKLDTSLHLKTKMPIRDLTNGLEGAFGYSRLSVTKQLDVDGSVSIWPPRRYVH